MSLLAPNRSPDRLKRRLAALTASRFSPLAVFEALATPHGVDRYLELVNPMLTVRELRAEITDVRRSTDDSVTLTLRPTRQWDGFRAGQYVQVAVDVDGVRRSRSYSPACSQHRSDGKIELTIRAHPDGVVSQYLHRVAAPGVVLGLSQASGEFTMPEPRPAKLVLISGGSGITPLMSMVRTLVDEDYAGEAVFLHYAFDDEHVAYRDELRALHRDVPNIRVVLAYTEQTTGGDLHGFFGAEHLAAAAPWHAEAQAYLCGPPPLMQSVREHYDAAGLSGRLHTEDFTPPPVVVDDGAASGTVSFARSDLVADNTGATLLEQAEAAGLSPEFGCRMGICFSCTQIKTSGSTRNVRSGELNADPDTEIQLCISVPVGDVALDI